MWPKIRWFLFTKMLQLLGDSVPPSPSARALPLDPTGGLCHPDPLTHFAMPPPHFFPKFTLMTISE